MNIIEHYGDKDTVDKVYVFSEDLGFRISFNRRDSSTSNTCFLDEIQVSEYDRAEDAYVEKFYFKYGKQGNTYRIKNGFYATELLGKDDPALREMKQSTAKLKRLFYDEETKRNTYGCILEAEFKKGIPSYMYLFDLVNGILVPVASLAPNGTALKEDKYAENVQIEQSCAPNARPLKRLTLSGRSL